MRSFAFVLSLLGLVALTAPACKDTGTNFVFDSGTDAGTSGDGATSEAVTADAPRSDGADAGGSDVGGGGDAPGSEGGG